MADQNFNQNNLVNYSGSNEQGSNSNIILRSIKNELKFNLDAKLFQKSIISSINEIIQQNQFKQNDMENKILILVGEAIDKLSNNLIASF